MTLIESKCLLLEIDSSKLFVLKWRENLHSRSLNVENCTAVCVTACKVRRGREVAVLFVCRVQKQNNNCKKKNNNIILKSIWTTYVPEFFFFLNERRRKSQ